MREDYENIEQTAAKILITKFEEKVALVAPELHAEHEMCLRADSPDGERVDCSCYTQVNSRK
jgi:hypothetical protein